MREKGYGVNSLLELVERLVPSSCTLVMEQAWVRLLQLLPWFREELDLERPRGAELLASFT